MAKTGCWLLPLLRVTMEAPLRQRCYADAIAALHITLRYDALRYATIIDIAIR